MEKQTVDMCQFYSWRDKPVCVKGHHASLRCHSRREDCSDYQPSEHYSEKSDRDPWELDEGFDLDRIKLGVDESERLHAFHQYVGYLIGKGCPWGKLVEIITDWNGRNRPPFRQDELMTMLKECWQNWADPWQLEDDDWQLVQEHER